MRKLIQFFGSWLQFSYSCFDRVVINGYLLGFNRVETLVHFFRKIVGVDTISQEVLRGRSNDYQRWVQGYALARGIPIQWAEKGVRKEEFVRPHLNRFLRKNQWGVYYIIKSLEQSTTYRIRSARRKTVHPHLKKERSLFTHYYFYLVDEVLGPMVLRVGSFLPFKVTAYVNGHNFIERQLVRKKVQYRKQDNAFVWVEDPAALQKAAEGFSPEVIAQRLDYWAFRLGPKFSQRERLAAAWRLHRLWAVNQVEYCRNFVFKRHFPIRSFFERSCELSLYRLLGSRVVNLFGRRTKHRFRGTLQNVLQRLDSGHHVFRTYLRTSFLKMYEKFQTFLRLEIVVNDLRDFYLRKSLKYLPEIKARLEQITEGFADLQAEALDVHADLDLFGQLAQPVQLGKTKMAGIKLEHTRILRLFEILLQRGGLKPWTSKELWQTVLQRFHLTAQQYTLNQLRYDLRKLRAHQLLLRETSHYAYRLTEKGNKVALMFLLFRKRVYGPIAGSLFLRQKGTIHSTTHSKLEQAYRRVDHSIDQVVKLLAA